MDKKEIIKSFLTYTYYKIIYVITKVIIFLITIFDDILVLGGFILFNLGLNSVLTEYKLEEFLYLIIGIELIGLYLIRVKESKRVIKEEV